MWVDYIVMKYLYLFIVVISIMLFVLCFFWKCCGLVMMDKCWVKIMLYINDMLLFVSGIVLIFIIGFYFFSL